MVFGFLFIGEQEKSSNGRSLAGKPVKVISSYLL